MQYIIEYVTTVARIVQSNGKANNYNNRIELHKENTTNKLNTKKKKTVKRK